MPWWAWLLSAVLAIGVTLALTARAARRNRDALRRLRRLLPDCLALLRDLLGDPDVPRRAKIVAGATVTYLALPIDLIPDFIPVLGHLDDVLIVAWALRQIIATAGRDRVTAHWHGDAATLERILWLSGVT